MPRVGYHCSHEQYPPSALLRLVGLAEEAGFQSAMCSDHIHPWSEDQGHSGFAWSWLGAAMHSTSLSFGAVTVPGGWRYHPAIIAQAAATLGEMFPGRFWFAAGSGEALNEHIVGRHWPDKSTRNARLREAVEIIRALWTGETVTRHDLIPTEDAKLYSLPETPPRIVAAALSAETARWAAQWADGLITVVRDRDSMRRIVDAFREGGGEDKPIYLQAQLAFADSHQEALDGAWEQWRTVIFPSPVLASLRTPAEFDGAGAFVSRAEIEQHVRVSSDIERHLEWLIEDAEMGFEEINLHNLCRRGQERFIEEFGERVVPRVAAVG